MEVQCNLQNLIKWKKCEHTTYDYSRAADDFLAVTGRVRE